MIKVTGNYKPTLSFLTKLKNINLEHILHRAGKRGVTELGLATPKNTGLTSLSWTYEIRRAPGYIGLVWKNTNIQNGIPIAIILQYGHATRNGGFVPGQDYINPVIQPIIDGLVKELNSYLE